MKELTPEDAKDVLSAFADIVLVNGGFKQTMKQFPNPQDLYKRISDMCNLIRKCKDYERVS